MLTFVGDHQYDALLANDGTVAYLTENNCLTKIFLTAAICIFQTLSEYSRLHFFLTY